MNESEKRVRTKPKNHKYFSIVKQQSSSDVSSQDNNGKLTRIKKPRQSSLLLSNAASSTAYLSEMETVNEDIFPNEISSPQHRNQEVLMENIDPEINLI